MLGGTGTMSVTLRLLSPDLPTPLVLAVEPSVTILQVKEAALPQWPSGDSPWPLNVVTVNESRGTTLYPNIRFTNINANVAAASNYSPGKISDR